MSGGVDTIRMQIIGVVDRRRHGGLGWKQKGAETHVAATATCLRGRSTQRWLFDLFVSD